MIIVYRVIYSNKKPSGIMLMVYKDMDSSRPKIKVLMSNITEPSKPIFFMEAALLSPHKAVASLKFLQNSQKIKISAEIETGFVADHPAIQAKVDYSRAPKIIKKIVDQISCLLPGMAFMLGISQKEQRNPPHQVKLIVIALSPGVYDIFVRTPTKSLTISDARLPFSLPEGEVDPATQQQSYPLKSFLDVRSLLLNNMTGVCTVHRNNLTTFSGAEIQTLQVPNCPLILAEDIRQPKQFSLRLTQESSNDITKTFTFKTPFMEITFQRVNGEYEVQIDHVHVELSVLPLQPRSDSSITISKKNDQLVLSAYGQLLCYYDGDNVTIEANPITMLGRIQGLCGRFDGEQELRTPSGYIAKNDLSFALSWVHAEGSCDGACKLQHSLVKLENTIQHLGQESVCSTVDNVLQCQEKCLATSTTSIPVGVHCLPVGSATDLLDTEARFAMKSEDLVYMVDAHTGCSCKDQQCAA
ncbi:vitellogenin-2-like [Eublepharis macularius]|uniref:Vitellogenin-2-like n=1 Tax=Eublepharis macularius TaxID=481883 RepID=A0AA97JGF5_EUBMA|nr:vitellogenin-2-like [Eublepharis macularius]